MIALGTWRHRAGKDFVALRGRRRPAVVVHLRDAPFGRLIVSADDPAATLARTLQPAYGSREEPC